MYRHLNVTGNLDLINLDRFKLTTNPEKGATYFELYNGDTWVPLIKQTGEFSAPKSLRDRLGGVNTIKIFLGVDKTHPALERSVKSASKFKRELPTDLEMEVYLWKSFRRWLKIFVLRHERHHRMPTLTCDNFQGSIRLYKTYRVNS